MSSTRLSGGKLVDGLPPVASSHHGRLIRMYSAKTFELNNVDHSIIGFNSKTQSVHVRYQFYALLLSDLKSYRFMIDKISNPKKVLE